MSWSGIYHWEVGTRRLHRRVDLGLRFGLYQRRSSIGKEEWEIWVPLAFGLFDFHA